MQQALRQGLHIFSKRCRKQQRLPLGGQQRQHALQFVGKAEVQQAVSLVQDQVLYVLQAQCVVVHQIEQAPRRGHNDVGPAAQAHHLRVDGHTTIDHRHFESQRITQMREHIAHLHRQLARGHQHQRAHGAAEIGLTRMQHMLLHQGQGKRQGFT